MQFVQINFRRSRIFGFSDEINPLVIFKNYRPVWIITTYRCWNLKPTWQLKIELNLIIIRFTVLGKLPFHIRVKRYELFINSFIRIANSERIIIHINLQFLFFE